MIDRVPCEFFLIRYVPDPVKGEFANIGVFLREVGQDDSTRVRFTRDWTRVRCVNADADIDLLEALEAEIGARLRLGGESSRSMIAVIEESFSNSIQITEGRACLAENLTTELELLMQLYVDPKRMKSQPKRTGRAAIAGEMRRQFERAGVWALMRKKIAAATYTSPGDPMKIDCGYRPNGTVKMFQAVSLDGDVEAAKVLAYTAPRLREGVVRIEGARLELTALVEPLRVLSDEDQGEVVDRYRFGVETMESQEIRVLTMNDLARAVETAKVELHL